LKDVPSLPELPKNWLRQDDKPETGARKAGLKAAEHRSTPKSERGQSLTVRAIIISTHLLTGCGLECGSRMC
jgi:hypothetical protein